MQNRRSKLAKVAQAIFVGILCVFVLLSARAPEKAPDFVYDGAARYVDGEVIGGPNAYDASVLQTAGSTWLAWLDFVPGQGDKLMLAQKAGEQLKAAQHIRLDGQQLANPRLVRSGKQRFLSFEMLEPSSQKWRIYVINLDFDEAPSKPFAVSPASRNALFHQTAVDASGRLHIVWQGERAGQYDIFYREMRSTSAMGDIKNLSQSAVGDWHPALATLSDGSIFVAWDSYRGDSFDVLCRRLTARNLGPVQIVADGPAFQGRVAVAADSSSGVWLAWEQGAHNWGKRYRGIEKMWHNITDDYGPVHRFRQLQFAHIDRADNFRQPPAMPAPAFAAAMMRENKRQNADRLGVFYERPQISVDRHNRLQVLYRHYFQPQVGKTEAVIHHIEKGWQIQARTFSGAKWSEAVALNDPQRDGMQRLAISGASNGKTLAAVWTAGRTDRRDDGQTRGLRFAEISFPLMKDSLVVQGHAVQLKSDQPAQTGEGDSRETTTVGGREFGLYFGDLHRHTDLSLCFPFYDGSLDDAYRYGIETDALDFLAVTDHSRDIAKGDPRSQAWWRSIKQVTRHSLDTGFQPFYAFERSTRNTDHNVISLKDDILRSHLPLLPEFWQEIDQNTITIPHATAPPPAKALSGKIWEWHDDDKRPLLEIYQAFRDKDVALEAHAGLDLGYKLGFIASSDHLSTSGAYACVWSEAGDRESLFRSMQARRTYAATDKIVLRVACSDHWMGETIASDEKSKLQVAARGTAAIAHVNLVVDGKVWQQWQPRASARQIDQHFSLPPKNMNWRYLYVHIVQSDGEQAWSSPIWRQLN